MKNAEVFINHSNLTGTAVFKKSTTAGALINFFEDENASAALPAETILYNVEAWLPVADGTEGGLFYGVTKLNPGKIGTEYYMTKGHFHEKADRGEFYWGIEGEGVLILMDRNRQTRGEIMKPGSLHYIPGHTAHRVANTGNTVLSFGACWPSDAGHNYQEIADNGFSARLMEIDGKPELISSDTKTDG